MPIELAKLQNDAPELVELSKTAQAVLEKNNLDGHQAKVALVLDISGSMGTLYRTGKMQQVAERVLALGTRFDDDGAIDVFAFGLAPHYLGTLTITDYQGGIARLVPPLESGTNYAGAIALVREHYKQTGPGLPVYVLFLTDGEPGDPAQTEDQLRASSRADGIWWEFVGVGGNAEQFPFLNGLDNLTGRLIDNAHFFADDLDGTTDEDVYIQMMREYPAWIPQARQNSLIA